MKVKDVCLFAFIFSHLPLDGSVVSVDRSPNDVTESFPSFPPLF